jgi:phosphoribosyl 1,2-cyclic phosphodiesterase
MDMGPVESEPRLEAQSLGSGSSGNALFVAYGATAVLVDCGVGYRQLAAAARGHGRRLDSLDALLLTHEHIDHVRSLPYVTAGGMPVVATHGTARMARVRPSQLTPAAADQPVTIGPLTIWALPVRHDAVEPCGYLIETPGGNLTVLTDLGSWDDGLAEAIRHSDLVVLEANHDGEMLRRGPYPPHLKRRVASAVGHLANDTCGRALAAAFADGRAAPTVWLAHLSATNNRPEMAEATVAVELASHDLALDVSALPRRTAGPRWVAERGHGSGTTSAAGSWQPPALTGQLRLNLGNS